MATSRPGRGGLDAGTTQTLLRALQTGDTGHMSSSLKGLPSKIVLEAVSLLKKQANEAFARGSYKDAADLYTQAISGAPGEKTLHSNRSLAYLRMRNYQAALDDAQEAIKLDCDWVKGNYRKGAALLALGRAQEALPYLKKVAAELPEDQECRDLLAKAIKDVADEDAAAAAAAQQQQQISEHVEGDAVTLPRKVYYPTQHWFTEHQVGQALQRQLQAYSDLDGPRRLIATLSDRHGLVRFWTSYLSSSSSPSLGPRVLMVGSLGGVAPFHVQLLKGAGSHDGGGDGGGKVVVVERYAWVANVVRGVLGKNIMMRRRKRLQQQQQQEEEEGDGNKAAVVVGEEEKIVLNKKRPHELLLLPAQGEGEVVVEGEEEREEPFDSLLWLDWDFSLLGTGYVRFVRSVRQQGLLLLKEGVGGGARLGARVMAVAIEILPAAQEGEGREGRRPKGIERMIWELGPSKFDLPDKAYRVLTEEVEVWHEADLSEARPKQQPVSFPILHKGRVDAIVYWYHLLLPTADEKEVVVLDSSRYESIGRGVTYMDPMEVEPSHPPLQLSAYRSESQMGFWPLPEACVSGVCREYRLPRWYPDMLVDEARNAAYERAIGRVCKDRRVLDVGSGSGLLSTMAVQAGAGKVLGCEQVSELAELSKTILGPDVKIFVKDVRKLRLAMAAEVVLHEVFDSGVLGEGVLHLLEPLLASSTPPPRMLPARVRVFAQLLELRFEEVEGVNLTLLNPYRVTEKDGGGYVSSDCHDAVAMTEPFLLDTVDFSVDTPGNIKGLRPGTIRTCRAGVVSAARIWFVVDFGDDKKEDGEGEGTVLDSREGHWGYALHYLPEAKFEQGDLVPFAASRAGATYSIRMPEDLVRERLLGTPRVDQAWLLAQEKADKTTDEILQRIAMTAGRNESKLVFRVAQRMASHPAEFGIEPVMAARFFHSVMRAKKHGQASTTIEGGEAAAKSK